MSVSLSAEVEARLRAETAKRDLSPEELATRAIGEYIPEETTRPPKHRLSFIGMGAPTSGATPATMERCWPKASAVTRCIDTSAFLAAADANDDAHAACARLRSFVRTG